MSVNPAFTPILDAFVNAFNTEHSDFAGEVNKNVATFNAAKGEKVSPRKYFLDSNDQDVKDLLEKWDKITAALKQIEETLTVKMEEDIAANSGDSASAKSWLDEHQKEISKFNSARRGIIKSIANFGMGDAEKEYLENELVSVSRPKGSAANSGIKRPRFESITVNGDELDKPTLTSLANATKVSKEDIDKALYPAAGVDDLAKFEGEVVEFSLTNKDGEQFAVVAEPKKSAAQVNATEQTTEADDSNDEAEPTDEELASIEDAYADDED